MLTLDYDPAVLAALQAAFPTPPNHAKQQLEKYIRLLEREMRRSLLQRTEYERKLGAYTIPSKTLTDKSPTLGNKIARVHAWLRDSGFGLLKILNKDRANNIFKEISLFAPTDFLIIKQRNLLDELRKMSGSELSNYVDTLTHDWEEIISGNYADFSLVDTKNPLYLTSEIDIDSLKNYMRSIVNQKTTLSRINEEVSLDQAENVLRVAQFFNGFLPQKIIKKPFGRTYYEGTSVVSVSKELRMAFLGDSWEYDCKSCSTAWKMGFANEWHSLKKKRLLTVREKFCAMTLFLEDKESFFHHVANQVFINLNQKDYKKILKEAMTALGFGAKLGTGKWLGMNGEEKITSLYEVFNKDMAELTRFVNCDLVKEFNKEQQILNKYIVAKFSVDSQWHQEMEKEIKRKKMKVPFSPSQKIVWLFQHAETIMMDTVRDELLYLKKTVLANVHDAIVIREQLSEKELTHIEQLVRVKTNISYFALGETQYQRIV